MTFVNLNAVSEISCTASLPYTWYGHDLMDMIITVFGRISCYFQHGHSIYTLACLIKDIIKTSWPFDVSELRSSCDMCVCVGEHYIISAHIMYKSHLS